MVRCLVINILLGTLKRKNRSTQTPGEIPSDATAPSKLDLENLQITAIDIKLSPLTHPPSIEIEREMGREESRVANLRNGTNAPCSSKPL